MLLHRILLPVLAVALCGGCAKFDIRKPIPWAVGADDENLHPGEVVASWHDAVRYRAGEPAQRGFGGRLMFYPEGGKEPIKVDGTLVVYAFDETQRGADNSVPDRKYVFSSDTFPKHYSKSELGHSYSFWLPWDQVGGSQTDISLIARFTPDVGGMVVAKQSRHLLPGKQQLAAHRPAPADRRSAAGVRQVSHVERVDAAPSVAKQRTADPRMSVTTIQLPPSFDLGGNRRMSTLR